MDGATDFPTSDPTGSPGISLAVQPTTRSNRRPTDETRTVTNALKASEKVCAAGRCRSNLVKDECGHYREKGREGGGRRGGRREREEGGREEGGESRGGGRTELKI